MCATHSVMSYSLRSHGLQLAKFLCSWNSPGKNTEVGCHSLLQEIFPIQGLNLGLLHCGQILYHLSHQFQPLLEYFKNKSLFHEEFNEKYSSLLFIELKCVFLKFPSNYPENFAQIFFKCSSYYVLSVIKFLIYFLFIQ